MKSKLFESIDDRDNISNAYLMMIGESYEKDDISHAFEGKRYPLTLRNDLDDDTVYDLEDIAADYKDPSFYENGTKDYYISFAFADNELDDLYRTLIEEEPEYRESHEEILRAGCTYGIDDLLRSLEEIGRKAKDDELSDCIEVAIPEWAAAYYESGDSDGLRAEEKALADGYAESVDKSGYNLSYDGETLGFVRMPEFGDACECVKYYLVPKSGVGGGALGESEEDPDDGILSAEALGESLRKGRNKFNVLEFSDLGDGTAVVAWVMDHGKSPWHLDYDGYDDGPLNSDFVKEFNSAVRPFGWEAVDFKNKDNSEIGWVADVTISRQDKLHESAESEEGGKGNPPGGWFDETGYMVKELPDKCISDCSQGGKNVEAECREWSEMLGFGDGLDIPLAKGFLKATGGWEKDELEAMSPEDTAMTLLWVVCCDLKDDPESPVYIGDYGRFGGQDGGPKTESVEKRGFLGKPVMEGAGAGYTVQIKGLKFGKILETKLVKGKKRYEDYHECKVSIVPGYYEIAAEDYYTDFFWQLHEIGETPTAKIDGGVATVEYSCNSYDEEECDDELRRELENREIDISFDYGWGWVHVDLPEKIEADNVHIKNASVYFYIKKLELDAPELADAVNGGNDSIYDMDGEEEEEAEGDGVQAKNEVISQKELDELKRKNPKMKDISEVD